MELSGTRSSSADQQPPAEAGSSAGTSWGGTGTTQRDHHQVQLDVRHGAIVNWVEDLQQSGSAGGGRRDLGGRLEASDKLVGGMSRQGDDPPPSEPSVPPARPPPTTFGTKSYAGALKVASQVVLGVKPTSGGGCERVESAVVKDSVSGKSLAGSDGGSQDGGKLSTGLPGVISGATLASTSAVSLVESSHSSITDSSHSSASNSGSKAHKGAVRTHHNTSSIAKGQSLTVSKGEGVRNSVERTTRSGFGSSEELSVQTVVPTAKLATAAGHKGSTVSDTPSPKPVPTTTRQPAVGQPSVTKITTQQPLVEQKQTKPKPAVVPNPPLMELTAQVNPPLPPPNVAVAEQVGMVTSSASTPKPDLWFPPAHQGSWPESQQLPGTTTSQHGLPSAASDQATLLEHTFSSSPHHNGSHLSCVSTAAQSQPLPFSMASPSQPAVASSQSPQDIAPQPIASVDAKSNLSIAAPAFVPSRPSPSPSNVPQPNMTPPQMSSQLRAEFLQPTTSMSLMSPAAMHRPRFPPTAGIPPAPPATIRVPSSIAAVPPVGMLGMFQAYPPPPSMQLPVQAPPPPSLLPAHHFMMPHTVMPLQQQQPQKMSSTMLSVQGLAHMVESNSTLVQVISPGGSEPEKATPRRDAMQQRGPPPHGHPGRHQSRGGGSDRHTTKGVGGKRQGFDASLVRPDAFPAHAVAMSSKGGASGAAKSFNKAPLLPTPTSYFPGTQTSAILSPQQMQQQMQQMLFNGGLARMPFLPGLPRSNSTSFPYNRQY